ncbi:MAG: MFS transporter [Desulfuromonadales bacterium]|nr:MFS transporter [Desulfuromonadales bacterium]MBN2792839.1 MFS transporter [Desulfuromonadales bacterium]
MNHQLTSRTLLLRLFLPFGLGYFVSYLYRTVNAVIAPDLVADLNLSAASLGLLTSAYFLTFAAFQLPLGVLLDRYGPRRVESALLLIAAVGALVFSQAQTLTGVICGRALIGLGVSACLMAAFKAFSGWLPQDRLPLANGVQMMSGGLGALTATTPVQAALQVTDWRGVFSGLAGVTLVAALVIFLVVPDQQQHAGHETLREQFKGLGRVLTHRHFWRIAPWAFMAQASYLSVQGLWTGPWLRDVAALDRTEVARTLWWIAVAMIIGYLTLGRLAERLAKRGIPPAVVACCGMLLFILVQLMIIVFPQYGRALWIAFGFFGTAAILPYAVLSQIFPPGLTGRCNTSLNLLVFIGAFSAQWLIGAIIGLWPSDASGGYSPQGYRAAFLVLIMGQLVAALWYWLAGRRVAQNRVQDE